MEENGFVILAVALGIFIIIMLVLLYIYLKGKYICRHLDDDYKKEIDLEDDD